MSENNNLQLSEEETKIINEMMEDNKKTIEAEQAEKTVDECYKSMKKLLKMRSKTELIEVVWNYGIQLRSMQHALQVMLDENAELKTQNAHLLGES